MAAILDITALPDDPATLRALLIGVLAERDGALAERDALEAQNDRLRHILLKLQRHQFGRKSERLPEAQLELGLADLETAIAVADAEAEKRDPDLRKERAAKRRASRGALPAHLPRIEVLLAPESAVCPCCAKPMVEIGADTSEQLDVIPAQFRKNALFAGSDEGAQNWAAIASLIETSKLNAIDPQCYLTDLLTRLVEGGRMTRIDKLMPWCWGANEARLNITPGTVGAAEQRLRTTAGRCRW